MDFTLKKYESLIQTLKGKKYKFLSLREYLLNYKNLNNTDSIIILRHDVDKNPNKSLKMAELEHSLGISGSYYFRAVPCSWDEKIIKRIDRLGHEIGYHYETMDTSNGNIDKAWDEFQYYLEKIRKISDVNTICMHGSPRSKFDNKDIWNKYNYKNVGIIGEPYYDINFNDVFYLTDTGRRWDGFNVSVRDKVNHQSKWIDEGLIFHSTDEIISRVLNNSFPKRVMFNFHPQRWNVNFHSWLKELIIQNLKNQIKKIMIIKSHIII